RLLSFSRTLGFLLCWHTALFYPMGWYKIRYDLILFISFYIFVLSKSFRSDAAVIFSYIGVFALLAYRFILSYGLVQNQIRLNPFHFFLYLCAFEIVPI